jgi:large repetitive protein
MKIQAITIAILVCCPALRAGVLTAGATMFNSYTEGVASPGQLATFFDSDPNESLSNLSATINWGDGTLSSGTIVSGGSGVLAVSGVHTYAEEGTYLQTITASSSGGSQATVMNAAAVADAPLTGMSSVIPGTEGASFSAIVGMFTDANLAALPSDFNVSINWGDGTAGTGTVTNIGPGQFQVTGTHVYAEEGSFTASVHVTDVGGSQTSFTSTATIADAPLTPSPGNLLGLVPGVVFTRRVAFFTDANPSAVPSDFTGVINWGDGTPGTVGTIVALPSGEFAVSGLHDYLSPGQYSALVSIFDMGGATASITDAALVATAPEPGFGATVAAALAILAILRRRYRASA